MKLKSLINYTNKMVKKHPYKYAQHIEWEGHLSEDVVGSPIPIPKFDPETFVGAADAQLNMYGYPSGLTIKLIDLQGNWMYCETPSSMKKLYKEDYAPDGSLITKVKNETVFEGVVYDLNTFTPHSLPGTLDLSEVENNLRDKDIALLRALFNQQLTGERIVNYLRHEYEGNEESLQVIKKYKIRDKFVGGRWIQLNGNDVTIGYFLESSMLDFQHDVPDKPLPGNIRLNLHYSN